MSGAICASQRRLAEELRLRRASVGILNSEAEVFPARPTYPTFSYWRNSANYLWFLNFLFAQSALDQLSSIANVKDEGTNTKRRDGAHLHSTAFRNLLQHSLQKCNTVHTTTSPTTTTSQSVCGARTNNEDNNKVNAGNYHQTMRHIHRLPAGLYYGEVDANGRPHSELGVLRENPSCKIWVGQFESGCVEGLAIHLNLNGEIYEGDVSKSQYHGMGTFHSLNGERCAGFWVEGVIEGRAVVRKADGVEEVCVYDRGVCVSRKLRLYVWTGDTVKAQAAMTVLAAAGVTRDAMNQALLAMSPSALHAAVAHGDLDLLNLVLGCEIDIETRSRFQFFLRRRAETVNATPLQCACYLGIPEMVKALLSFGANPNAFATTTAATRAQTSSSSNASNIARLCRTAACDHVVVGRSTPVPGTAASSNEANINSASDVGNVKCSSKVLTPLHFAVLCNNNMAVALCDVLFQRKHKIGCAADPDLGFPDLCDFAEAHGKKQFAVRVRKERRWKRRRLVILASNKHQCSKDYYSDNGVREAANVFEQIRQHCEGLFRLVVSYI